MGVLDIVPVRSATAPQIWMRLGQDWSWCDLFQAGVLTGDNVRKLFDYAKEKNVKIKSRKSYMTTNIFILVCYSRKWDRDSGHANFNNLRPHHLKAIVSPKQKGSITLNS